LSVFNKENDDDDVVRLLNDDSSKTGHNRFLKNQFQAAARRGTRTGVSGCSRRMRGLIGTRRRVSRYLNF